MEWKNVIAQIQTVRGLTQPQIAAKAGCAQATISDLARGKTTEPRHSLGVRLLALMETDSKRRRRVARETTEAI
ncbi:hypothetical protein RD110_10870 [Rhodoferax koreense]|uniref:HTH cro/C1-type domain-containing protein n=1 Tax=Rhodoferax koreensis TaxID=1842727 RepID=A0A1P8JV38_9BURK|nr:hypothetical protein RD110_10870 [Rhodoferax koreense]